MLYVLLSSIIYYIFISAVVADRENGIDANKRYPSRFGKNFDFFLS